MDVLPLDLTGDGALRAAAVADREVTRMEGVRLDHLAQYLSEVAAEWEPPAWQGPGAEQAVRLGGPGTPLVPEFAVCEIATALGRTQPAATSLCADVLDLAYRLRGLAQSVRCGHLTFARASAIARRTRDLTVEQARLVEERLCRLRETESGPMAMVARVPMSRLRAVVDQAVITIRGPETEQEASERVAASLYVSVAAAEPGAADVAARLSVADGVRLDRRLDEVAGWLAQIGDARPKAILRAVALGLLADPQLLKALDQMRRAEPDPPLPDAPASDAADEPLQRRAPGAAGDDALFLTPDGSSSRQRPGPLREPEPAEPELPDPSPADPALPDLPPEAAHHADPLPRIEREPDSPREVEHDGALALDQQPDRPPPGVARDPSAPPDVTRDASAPPDAEQQPDPPSEAEHEPAPPHRESHESALPDHAPVAAGIAGCPPALLAKFAKLTSTVLYLHLDRESGTWCEERGGALTKAQGEALVGHANVTIRPVLDLAEPLTYTGYVAPPRLKEQLALWNAGYCTFPYCHRRARAGDVDHQVPYGKNGATSSTNTHLPCRKHHRAKDKGGWHVVSPAPGIWVWTSPAGAVYLVTGGTTTPLNGPTSPLTHRSYLTASGVAASSVARSSDSQSSEGGSHAATAGNRNENTSPTVGVTETAISAAGTMVDNETGDSDTTDNDTTSSEPGRSTPSGGTPSGSTPSGSTPSSGTPSGGTPGSDASGSGTTGSTPPAPDRATLRTDVKSAWTPPWDPWQDPDPLTQDEHEVTYALVNAH